MSDATLPRVRVVVLNWNSAWFTRRCLQAIRKTDYPADLLDVVLVDNASGDGSSEQLRYEFPDVRIVVNPANLGFAEGCNRAMREPGVDAVALVNNDAVPEPGWLRPMVAGLDAPDVGAVAACLVLEPEFAAVAIEVDGGPAQLVSVRVDEVDATARVQMAGVRSVGRPDWPSDVDHFIDGEAELLVPVGRGERRVEVTLSGEGSAVVRTAEDRGSAALSPVGATLTVRAGSERSELLNGLGTELGEDLEGIDRWFGRPFEANAGGEPVEVQGFCGGGALLRYTMLEQVGFFDPEFFAYYEDTDLSWRARNAGWRIVTAPDAVIRHAFGGSGGAATAGFFFLNYRNWLMAALGNGTTRQRRRAVGSMWARLRWAIRANVLSPLKHRRRPNLRLVRAWLTVLMGIAATAPRRILRRGGAVGMQPTTRVLSRLQPAPSPRPPTSRPGGPLIVYVDLTAAEPGEPGERIGRELLQDLPPIGGDIDVVPVVRSASSSGYRRLSSHEYARVLGVAASLDEPAPVELDLQELSSSSVLAELVMGDGGRWSLDFRPSGSAGPPALVALAGSGDEPIFGERTAAWLRDSLVEQFGTP